MKRTKANNRNTLFCDNNKQWITVYKEGAIRPVTMKKYYMAHQWLLKLIPNLTLEELDRISYQK
ncbi:MAG: site-specific integrase, partial [Lachnospiraceae bacterium]|nr:site-specific integrase [Lachnospiraceae bacterium]